MLEKLVIATIIMFAIGGFGAIIKNRIKNKQNQ